MCYYYGELLKKAKLSNEKTKEYWFEVFNILFGVSKEQFSADWNYIKI